VQELEVAIFDLLTERALGTAADVQLDVIGKLVGQERLGLADEDYRTLIRVRIRVNRSDGHADQLIEILQLMAPLLDPTNIIYTEHYPAEVHIELGDPIGSVDPDLVFLMLNQAKAAGVRLLFMFSPDLESETFAFSSGASVLDTDRGFATSTPGEGGQLISGRSS
jgi:hypothetical protein